MEPKTIFELCALEPDAFLNPENFVTAFDSLPVQNMSTAEYIQKQYENGKKYATEYKTVGICANGTWFAFGKHAKGYELSSVTSYEVIGYHRNTKELLQGLLDGTAEVVVCRHNTKTDELFGKTIKPASY
jgi:hypothetical protein